VQVLDAADWKARRAAHERRVDEWLAPHLARRRAGIKHPVEDFLFTYYSFRPAQLRRWQPGPGMALVGADPEEFGQHFVRAGDGTVRLDVAAALDRRRDSIEWIHRLLTATAARPPHFGCLGMHEWAMVYRQTQEEVRHNLLPLRLGASATAALVDEITIRCSHFDAFRFFTPAARPLNALQPTRESQPEHDQPACLHANMDVYRWAYKLTPLVPSELVADCFALAKEIRVLDMRASPYDLAGLGYPPVHVETPEGRAEYVRRQRAFADRARPLRTRLIAALEDHLT
jgi:hypothetical protein